MAQPRPAGLDVEARAGALASRRAPPPALEQAGSRTKPNFLLRAIYSLAQALSPNRQSHRYLRFPYRDYSSRICG